MSLVRPRQQKYVIQVTQLQYLPYLVCNSPFAIGTIYHIQNIQNILIFVGIKLYTQYGHIAYYSHILRRGGKGLSS